MGDLLRMTFMIWMLVAVSLAATFQQSEWAHDLGLDRWMESALEGESGQECKREREFEQRAQALTKRLAVKDKCVRELIDGRITLFEAAAQFRRVNEENPVALEIPAPVDESPEEWACRQVIQWVCVSAQIQRATASEDLVDQLEKDLWRHKQQHNGAVVLPGAGPMP
jgi:hypothetical protein